MRIAGERRAIERVDVLGATKRWPNVAAVSLPLLAWTVDGLDLAELDAVLAEVGETVIESSERDALLERAGRDADEDSDPAWYVRRLRAELDAWREQFAPPSPVRVDRADVLASVALDVTNHDEAAAAPLLADPRMRDVLAWIGERVPPALRARLARVARAAVPESLRFAAVELLVERDVRAEEERIREELDRPAREAAARLARLAEERRAELLGR